MELPHRDRFPPQQAYGKELTALGPAALHLHREAQDAWNKLYLATTGISALVGSGGILWGISKTGGRQGIFQSSCCLPFGIY